MWSETSFLHIPGYLISPLTGWSIKIIHELRHFMRLLLLNINYLRHYFLSKPCRKILWILNTLPNGVIHHNMPLSTTNILIVSVSFPYRSPIVLLLFSYWEAETIRKQYGIERRINEWGTVEQWWLILLLSKSQRQWQDSNKLLWVSTCHLSTTTKFDRLMQSMSRIWNSLPNGVTHLSCPLSTSKFDKTMHKISWILNTLGIAPKCAFVPFLIFGIFSCSA